MNDFDWISGPLLQYLILGAGLIGLTVLWIGVKTEVHHCEEQIRSLKQELGELRGKGQVESSDPGPVASPGSATALHSLNLTARGRILRMSRRGESVNTIASALQVPTNEVELTLKLDQLSERRVG
jgi:hypothetical protein